MNLEVYDLRYENGVVRALTPDDGLMELPQPFDPYCYIDEDDLVLQQLRRHGCRLGDDAPDGYLKIEADDPMRVRDYADDHLGQVYESDVGFATSVMIDEDVSVAAPGDGDVLYFDIEVDDRGDFAEPDRAKDRVLSVAGVDSEGNEVYHERDNEERLLRDFLEDAAEYACLVGWNSEGYDFPYLENRCAELGIPVDWGRWVRHDLMPLYDMIARPTETLSNRLEDTGQREFGEGKTGVSAGEGRLYELWESGDDALREYNIRDADLVRRIDERYDLVEVLHVICDVCNYPPGQTIYESYNGNVRFAIGQVVDAKLLEVARRKGNPQPPRGSFEKPDDFPGGYVLDPMPGLYDDVVVPDYSGMYPNIVRSWNFGRETWVPDEKLARDDSGTWYIVDGEWAGCRAVKGETGGFVHPDDGERSVPAEAADELIELREGARDILDKGVKAINNTLYGVFASDRERYFGPHSKNITLIGQQLTGIVEDIAGQGHEYIQDVVYGDTDSVMIHMDDPEWPVNAAYQIADDLERQMKEWAAERGADPQYLVLDVDDVYDSFYIGDKKKRYFGHRIWADDEPADNMKMRGFVARTHDAPEPVREFQRDLMEAVLADEPTTPVIDEYKDRLFDGEWDAELATSKSLTKPVSEYDSSRTLPVHVRAAQAIREEKGDGAIRVGSKVGYIKYGDKTRDWTWVHDGETGIDLNARHYSHLWEERFKTAMEAIGVARHDQTGLSDFA